MKTIEQIVDEIVDRQGSEGLCKYCIYKYVCSGNAISGGPNGPIYAPCADGDPDNWFELENYIEEEKEMLEIERIIYNNPATVVWFEDGEKVVVKAHGEPFDKEKGVAMAIARKLYSRSEFVKLVESGKNQIEEVVR